jgi:microcystin-dependent protein
MARQPFNTRWAQGVETEDNLNSFKLPGDVRISTGWEGGQDKDAPPAGQENWWHNRVDTALQDIERQGVMTWHAQAIYGLGAPCYATDGYYYESLTTANTNNNPLTSPLYWRQIGQTLYASFSIAEYKDVAHNGAPDNGWLKCVGAVLLRASYPKLFAVIGTTYNTGGELSTQFRLPDWRGVFPRFLDDGRGINTGRTLSNIIEPSQNLAHGHGVNDPSHTHGYGSATFGTEMMGGGSNNYAKPVFGQTSNATTGISIQSAGGAEARPSNLAQVRWIRYL